MLNRPIPRTSLTVSPICLGTMTFGTPVGEREALDLIRHALDAGINFIDTANMYEGYDRYVGSSGGVAERIVGKAMSGKRSQFVLATKLGMKVGSEPEDEGTSGKAIRKHLDLSLQRLDTDYIDIYYLHKPDETADLTESLHALDAAIRAGKIRHYGVSNYSTEQLRKILEAADACSLPRPVINQPGFSYLKQDGVADLLSLCQSEQIAVAPYQVLQGGLLTGKYRRGQPIPPGSRKAEKPGWVWDMDDRLFDRLDEIEARANAHGLSMTQFAIAWALEQPAVVSAIMGIKHASQIDDAVAAARALGLSP
jgi:aryl-alcohol dehydrogenase-like predicted oxidoreductase